ncbi:MAG: hypothetical protein HWN81_00470 [Candidatus Lokiarchaeota archaeon]|nr:hypothetical protein [Candidatus Lokiarchaeota archaeon]
MKKNKYYYLDGSVLDYYNRNKKLHRLDEPAIEYADSCKAWYVKGKRHRLDGPAIEYANGYREWYVEGKLHRLDGPAIECASSHKEWWIDGEELTYEEFENYRSEVFEKNVIVKCDCGLENGCYNCNFPDLSFFE